MPRGLGESWGRRAPRVAASCGWPQAVAVTEGSRVVAQDAGATGSAVATCHGVAACHVVPEGLGPWNRNAAARHGATSTARSRRMRGRGWKPARRAGARSVHRKAWAKPIGAPTVRQGSRWGMEALCQPEARRPNGRGRQYFSKACGDLAARHNRDLHPPFGAERSDPWVLLTGFCPDAPLSRSLATPASPKLFHDLGVGAWAPSQGPT